MQDRPYQAEALEANVAEYDNGVRRMMNVMATGTGKTRVFGRLFDVMKSRLPGRQMIFAHRKELVKQAEKSVQDMYPHLKIGREMGNTKADVDSDIIVASIETLGREDSKRVERFDWNQFDKFVVDEAHHTSGDSYRRVLERAGCFAPDTRKLLLGVTATPRPDGALADIYEKVSYTYSIRQAIKDGWLVDVRGYQLKTSTSLANVSRDGDDFNRGELSRAVDNGTRNKQIVDFWKQYGEGRRTVAFCVDIQHGKDMAEAFRKEGIKAEYVWGEDPDREKKIERHKAGDYPVLCNCDVLTEGYDDWHISCVLLCAPTFSSIKFAQWVGRATRLDERTGNLRQWLLGPETRGWGASALSLYKTDCLVLDVVDNASRNSLITLPTLMGINSNLDLHGKSLLQAVEEMEEAQEKCPTLDLSKLTNIGDLQTTVQSVNLFEVKFPEEVEANSELTWFRAVGGGYKMLIPKETSKPGFVKISENVLGRWEIKAEINEDQLYGIRNSMEEAFKVADEQIRKRVSKQTLSYIKREATWHNKPVTKGQKTMLARLFPKRVWPFDHMTAGQASKIISERFTRGSK